MRKISFLQKIEPTRVKIMDTTVELLFTMGAAAAMEEAFAQPYLQTVCDMLQAPLESGGALSPPLSIEQQTRLICILAEAAGQELPLEELMQLPMADFTLLALAAQTEIITKTPWGDKSAKKA